MSTDWVGISGILDFLEVGSSDCQVDTTAQLAGIRDALDVFHDNETDLLLADNVVIIVAQSSEDIQLPN